MEMGVRRAEAAGGTGTQSGDGAHPASSPAHPGGEDAATGPPSSPHLWHGDRPSRRHPRPELG